MKRWILTYIGYPILTFLGKIFPSKREKLELKYIHLNNKFVKSENNLKKHHPEKVLLLPHCVQFDECEHRITKTIFNCEECGRCKISDIVKFGKKFDIIIRVATGGRLARRLVNEIKPDFIIAVACERELTEGISAVYPLPVVGIPNIRPNGPCVNTTVDLEILKKELEVFCNE